MDPRIFNSNWMHQANLVKTYKYILPDKYQRPFLGISISLIIVGAVSVIMGGVGFAGRNNGYVPSVFTGQDFWVGIAVSKLQH